MARFRLTLLSPTEYGLLTFDSDPDIWTETDNSKLVASRSEDDPVRDSVMELKGVCWTLGSYDFDDGMYLDDSPDGVGEGAYNAFDVISESLYAFGFTYKNTFGSFDLVIWDVTNDLQIGETLEFTEIGHWLSYECNVVIPADCVSVLVTFSQHDQRSGPLYIDDVSLSGNMILFDPDKYSRVLQRVGSFHKTLNSGREYDINELYYNFELVWNFCYAIQYENFRTVIASSELIYFDDGSVPIVIEELELTDGVITLGYKAIVDPFTRDVIRVSNLDTGLDLDLTTHYVIAGDGRSMTVSGQTNGDIIRVSYNRYFEVIFLDLHEEWLGIDDELGVVRKINMNLETIAEV